tara:strand:+ start:1055 stop:1480 length:426 start_codon:yes stop_codon:yes gene_type:complete
MSSKLRTPLNQPETLKEFVFWQYLRLNVLKRGFWKKLKDAINMIDDKLIQKYEHIKLHYDFHMAFFIYNEERKSGYIDFVNTNREILQQLCIAALKDKKRIRTFDSQELQAGMLASFHKLLDITQLFVEDLWGKLLPKVYP